MSASPAPTKLMGLIVDALEEVDQISAEDIESSPDFGGGVCTGYIQNMAKVKGKVKALLNIDQIVQDDHALLAPACVPPRSRRYERHDMGAFSEEQIGEIPLDLKADLDTELVEEFISDAREQLDNIEQGTLALEKNAHDREDDPQSFPRLPHAEGQRRLPRVHRHQPARPRARVAARRRAQGTVRDQFGHHRDHPQEPRHAAALRRRDRGADHRQEAAPGHQYPDRGAEGRHALHSSPIIRSRRRPQPYRRLSRNRSSRRPRRSPSSNR